ncbi:hypothetical protein T4D_4246 [Trichinella pseudospiralis]|uniref:Peptidase aspartic putative domain-containing protein n=1 Tax=Trichinella pseudospiralis TaxID=6337 RepID=A0A0V1F7R5_TRIPS|nr:hypothetical protein T4D_4246 [Trichinella pseudospiralis]
MGTVRSHAQQHDESAPRAAKEVLNNMYMDDLATSCNSVEEAQTLVDNHILDLFSVISTSHTKGFEQEMGGIKCQHTSKFGEFLRVRSQTDRHRGEGNFYKRNQIYRCEKGSTTLHGNRSKGIPGKYTTAALQIQTQERTRCLLCQKFHDISVCTQFLASDVEERWRVAKRLGLCHSCLKKGHRKIECSASRKTATGETTIHDLLKRKGAGDKKIDEKTEENITKVCLKMSVDKRDRSSSYSNSSLQIARAVICAENGIKRTANCILDSGAQRSFVRKEVVESLGLNGPKEHITISSFNQLNEHRKLMLVELRPKGVDNNNF